LAHRAGKFFHRRGAALQVGRGLFGALAQIGVATGDLDAGGVDRVGARAHGHQGGLHAGQRLLQCLGRAAGRRRTHDVETDVAVGAHQVSCDVLEFVRRARVGLGALGQHHQDRGLGHHVGRVLGHHAETRFGEAHDAPAPLLEEIEAQVVRRDRRSARQHRLPAPVDHGHRQEREHREVRHGLAARGMDQQGAHRHAECRQQQHAAGAALEGHGSEPGRAQQHAADEQRRPWCAV
jgi:hypothetical protein